MQFKIPIQVKTREVWSETGKEMEPYLVDANGSEMDQNQLEYIANIFNDYGRNMAKDSTRNMIKSLIVEKLKYRPVGTDHARIGAMIKRYGEQAVKNAIDAMATWSFEIADVINTLEKQAQKQVAPDSQSEISQRIDKITEDSNDKQAIPE